MLPTLVEATLEEGTRKSVENSWGRNNIDSTPDSSPCPRETLTLCTVEKPPRNPLTANFYLICAWLLLPLINA